MDLVLPDPKSNVFAFLFWIMLLQFVFGNSLLCALFVIWVSFSKSKRISIYNNKGLLVEDCRIDSFRNTNGRIYFTKENSNKEIKLKEEYRCIVYNPIMMTSVKTSN